MTHLTSEKDISSEFQRCLDRAEELSSRIRALSSKPDVDTNTLERFQKNDNSRQSVMIRRIFEKYADIIGNVEISIR